jgi:hypothetical protein
MIAFFKKYQADLIRSGLFFAILLTYNVRAQDSIPKSRIILFDLNISTSLTGKESAPLDMNYVSSFTKDKPYLQPSYYAGFSNSVAPRQNPYHHRGDNAYPGNDRQGSVYGQIGFSASFKLINNQTFLNRIRPKIGIYHSSRRFFAYNLRSLNIQNDTIYYANPIYPPEIIRNETYGNIYYTYSSKQVYTELGANIDIVRNRFFIFYSGFLFAYAFSYQNEFYMQQDLFSRTETISSTHITDKEPPSHSARILVPLGIQHRMNYWKKFSMGIFAEVSPGYETYAIRNGRSLSHPVCVFTWGLKFSFRPHRK